MYSCISLGLNSTKIKISGNIDIIIALEFGILPGQFDTQYINNDINVLSCPGNMPKYYPGLRDILPFGWVICLSDLGNILAYYLDKTTLLSLLY
jgi:hypothetical protein